jgi:hypothetical protein
MSDQEENKEGTQEPEVKEVPLESPLVDDEELEAEKESETSESEDEEKRVNGLTKEEHALKLMRAGVHNRDIVMSCRQLYKSGISHSKLGEMKKDMNAGINPLKKKGSNEQDQLMIAKLNQYVSLLKAKKEEQQQAIKGLLKLFVAISEMLDNEDPESKKKSELNQEAFNSLINTHLNLPLIDKFQFLLKE